MGKIHTETVTAATSTIPTRFALDVPSRVILWSIEPLRQS